MSRVAFPLLGFMAAVSACASERALVDTSRSPHAVLGMFGIDEVRWRGGLLGGRFDVCRDTMVPHLWTIFRDDQESHAWSNFLIAAGEGRGRDGRFHGPPFNDGDFLKWLEALAQVFAVTRDPALDRQMDAIIATVVKAQREDGYLHTQKIIPQRQGDTRAREFEDREHFETYNMGHLITAACVHHRATGKVTLLDAALRAAAYLERLAREAPDELARNAICPSHYMGVAELHRVTRDPRHLALLRTLIELRDRVPGTAVAADHNQDRVPLREAREAVGHAVRANYLYAGLADLFAETGDEGIARSLGAIAADVATQKLYVTGMTGALYDGASPDGSSRHSTIRTVHQAYGRDYQLPNLTAYNETCATIGYAMWMWRQFAVTGDANHADRFEQALYNGILPGISLEGRHYFYVNPLRRMADFTWSLRWSRSRTPNIKSSFCCPPNVVRTIAEAHNYVYARSAGAVWVNLYAASSLDSTWPGGGRLRLRQETDYPWEGAVRIVIEEVPNAELALRLRIPGWLGAGGARLRVNGTAVPVTSPGSFTEVRRNWQAGDAVELDLDLAPVLLEANPLVEEALNQVALRCGPLVYCVEAADLPREVRLTDVVLPVSGRRLAFKRERRDIAGAEVVMLTVPALAGGTRPWVKDELYREVAEVEPRPFDLTFTPYFAWGNRGEGDMTVWLPRR